MTKLLTWAACATVALVALANLVLCLCVAPHHPDAVWFYLPRMHLFLQNGFQHLDNYAWPVVTHPFLHAVLIAPFYLLGGENATALPCLFAWLLAIFFVYKISRELGFRPMHSAFAAACMGLIVEAMQEIPTSTPELLLPAMLGLQIWTLLSFRRQAAWWKLAVAGSAMGCALGFKLAAISTIPVSVFLVMVWLPRRAWFQAALFFLAGVAVFALPFGYVQNVQRYGHIVGPEFIRRAHITEGDSLAQAPIRIAKNVVKNTTDFISFDGVPPAPPVVKAQHIMRLPIIWLDRLVHLDTADAAFDPYNADIQPTAWEAGAQWGVIGFLLALPLAAIKLFTGSRNERVLVLAAGILMLSLSAMIHYGRENSRYFMSMGVLIMPLLACCLDWRSMAARLWLGFVVVAAIGTAALATVLHPSCELISMHAYGVDKKCVLSLSRTEQIFRAGMTNDMPCVVNFDSLVPDHATVAVDIQGGDHDTPGQFLWVLFGEHQTRRIVSIHPFDGPESEIPPAASYFLFDAHSRHQPVSGDIALGNGWHLRQLDRYVSTNQKGETHE